MVLINHLIILSKTNLFKINNFIDGSKSVNVNKLEYCNNVGDKYV